MKESCDLWNQLRWSDIMTFVKIKGKFSGTSELKNSDFLWTYLTDVFPQLTLWIREWRHPLFTQTVDDTVKGEQLIFLIGHRVITVTDGCFCSGSSPLKVRMFAMNGLTYSKSGWFGANWKAWQHSKFDFTRSSLVTWLVQPSYLCEMWIVNHR